MVNAATPHCQRWRHREAAKSATTTGRGKLDFATEPQPHTQTHKSYGPKPKLSLVMWACVMCDLCVSHLCGRAERCWVYEFGKHARTLLLVVSGLQCNTQCGKGRFTDTQFYTEPGKSRLHYLARVFCGQTLFTSIKNARELVEQTGNIFCLFGTLLL